MAPFGGTAPRFDPNSTVRLMIFIDGSNLFHGLKDYRRMIGKNVDLNYEKMVQVLSDGRRVVRSNFYGSRPPETPTSQGGFHEVLREKGFHLRLKPLKMKHDKQGNVIGSREKGVDVALATDLLSLAWEDAYDEAVVCSGDGDMAEAVEKAMAKGKNIDVAAFSRSLSKQLRETVRKTIYLDKLLDEGKI